jgi:hypothetical protein
MLLPLLGTSPVPSFPLGWPNVPLVLGIESPDKAKGGNLTESGEQSMGAFHERERHDRGSRLLTGSWQVDVDHAWVRVR